jgi:hypothetical protein
VIDNLFANDRKIQLLVIKKIANCWKFLKKCSLTYCDKKWASVTIQEGQIFG